MPKIVFFPVAFFCICIILFNNLAADDDYDYDYDAVDKSGEEAQTFCNRFKKPACPFATHASTNYVYPCEWYPNENRCNTKQSDSKCYYEMAVELCTSKLDKDSCDGSRVESFTHNFECKWSGRGMQRIFHEDILSIPRTAKLMNFTLEITPPDCKSQQQEKSLDKFFPFKKFLAIFCCDSVL
ncbi:hypothetical protein GPALN_006029 [Globodera pallida]|nr:hypothetical protein GPALN_006029 [Globodera pallida]